MIKGDAGLGGYMGGSGTCASVRSQLGVYLTGSILPADRAVVVRHLASCPACRSELADLAGLPGLLRRPACQDAAEVPGLDRAPSANPASGSALVSRGAPAPGGVQLSRLMRGVARR